MQELGFESSKSRNDVKGTHLVWYLSMPLYVVLVCLLNLGVGSISLLQNSCTHLLNMSYFGLISKTHIKAIHRFQNTIPTRYSGKSLIILALVFTFCNISNRKPKYFQEFLVLLSRWMAEHSWWNYF